MALGTPTRKQEVERISQQRVKVREMIDSILALAKELSEGTIEKVLAKSDPARSSSQKQCRV